MRQLPSFAAFVFLALWLPAAVANAQEPVRLPPVTVRAAPDSTAPSLSGIVTDTGQTTLAGVELTIIKLQRRVVSADDGTFRFHGIKPGTYSVRARKIGFAPQLKEVKVDKDGTGTIIALMPLPHYLLPVKVTATAGGLSGVVADTAYEPVPGATVSILGSALTTATDSSGRFFLPARQGSQMVYVGKPEFKERVIGVSIPTDSGRFLTVQIGPATGPVAVRSAWNIQDFSSRLAWRNRLTQPFYTRDDLQQAGYEWVIDAVRVAGNAQYDADCSAVKNGGPESIRLDGLTIDDIEGIEIRSSARSGGPTTAVPSTAMPGRGGSGRPVRYAQALSRDQGVNLSNEQATKAENLGRFCPLVYVWLR